MYIFGRYYPLPQQDTDTERGMKFCICNEGLKIHQLSNRLFSMAHGSCLGGWAGVGGGGGGVQKSNFAIQGHVAYYNEGPKVYNSKPKLLP